MYLKGLGVSPDPKKGLKFIREAANGNVNAALIEMGKIYEEGRYVGKDLNSALDYFLESKKRGFLDSEDDIVRIKKKLNSWVINLSWRMLNRYIKPKLNFNLEIGIYNV